MFMCAAGFFEICFTAAKCEWVCPWVYLVHFGVFILGRLYEKKDLCWRICFLPVIESSPSERPLMKNCLKNTFVMNKQYLSEFLELWERQAERGQVEYE